MLSSHASYFRARVGRRLVFAPGYGIRWASHIQHCWLSENVSGASLPWRANDFLSLRCSRWAPAPVRLWWRAIWATLGSLRCSRGRGALISPGYDFEAALMMPELPSRLCTRRLKNYFLWPNAELLQRHCMKTFEALASARTKTLASGTTSRSEISRYY